MLQVAELPGPRSALSALGQTSRAASLPDPASARAPLPAGSAVPAARSPETDATAADTAPREVMVVAIGDHAVGVPGDCLREIVAVDHGGLVRVGGGLVLRLRDRLVGVVDGRVLLGLDGADPEPRGLVLVVEAAGRRYGLLVARILGTEAAAVRPPAALLRAPRCVLGQALLLDGRPAFVLDADACAQALPGLDAADVAAAPGAPQERLQEYLVVRVGSGGRKAIPLAQVDRVERVRRGEVEFAAGAAVVQRAGRLLRLESLGPESLGDAPGGGDRVAVVVNGETGPVGFVVDEVCEVLSAPASAFRAVGNGGYSRAAILAGKAVDFLDVGAYFNVEHSRSGSA